MSPRNQYAIAPGQESLIQVDLLTPEGRHVTGQLVAIHSVGATVRFPEGIAPELTLNQQTMLRFSGNRLEQPVTATVNVQSRTEGGGWRRYGFWFARRHEIETRLLPKLEDLFNRRGGDRVQPDPNLPVLVTLESVPGVVRLCGPLLSISTTGIGIRTSLQDEAAFMGYTRAKASFTLPSRPQASLSLAVVIRHRKLAGHHVSFGLEFEDPAGESYQRQKDALNEYVRERQQEILRRRRAG